MDATDYVALESIISSALRLVVKMGFKFFSLIKFRSFAAVAAIPLCIFMSACGGGGGDSKNAPEESSSPGTGTTVNKAPTVNAGDSRIVESLATVRLTASAKDEDGSIASYKWTQTGGDSVTVSNADKATATFKAPALSNNATSSILTFSITVTDNNGATASDLVTLTVVPANNKPTVDAGSDVQAQENTKVTLNATASDTDGTIASYSWSQTSGTQVNLSGANTSRLIFTAPILTNGATSQAMIFKVTVTDDDGGTASDLVTVNVESTNNKPVVDAGNDVETQENTEVILNATASDTDGTIESYSWLQISGTEVSLLGADTPRLTFTTPPLADPTVQQTMVFEVTVADNRGSTASDRVTIVIKPRPTTGLVTLSWNKPTQNTDSSALTDLAGFKIYYGESQDSLSTNIVINDPAAYTQVIENLTTNKTYFFAMTAFNSKGVESDLSTIVSKLIN